jgi:hypothetical protein
MVTLAETACTMDVSSAQQALAYIDMERQVEQDLIFETLRRSANAMGLTDKQLMKLLAKVDEIKAVWEKTRAKIESEADTTEEKVKVKTRYILNHLLHLGLQAWSMIEMAFGLGKNTAARMVGFAVSAMSSIISSGYAAAAQYAAMGPVGAVFAVATLAMTTMTVAQQASVIAQQAGLESQTIPAIGTLFSNYTG